MTARTVKHRVRNALIAGVYCGRRLVGRHRRPQVIALHDIGDAGLFREKVAFLSERYDVVGVDRLTDGITNGRQRVALTFDDGYREWSETVAPILLDAGIPALFFVCSGYVGLRGEEANRFARINLRRSRPLSALSTDQLAALAREQLFDIGGHTTSHIDLGAVQDPAVIASEIGDDRKRLQDWTGRAVTQFAYPFGRRENIPTMARHHVQQAGYEAAYTILPQPVLKTGDRYFIGRNSLVPEQSSFLWKCWLGGGYNVPGAHKIW